MEAVWKRILLLLLVGVLLTLIVFPIVRGEPDPDGKNTSSGERIPTKFKEVYIGPVDRSLPQDGRIDIYMGHPEECVFTYQLLATDENGSYEVRVTYVSVWLIISMGKYENITRSRTDIRGRVHYNFTTRFCDSYTGEPFEFEKGEWKALLTLSVEFYGNKNYFGVIRTRECMYYGYRPFEPPTWEEKIFMLVEFLVETYILISLFIGLPSLFLYQVFSWTAKGLKQWELENELSEYEPMPRFKIVPSPSGYDPAGPSSPRP